MPVDAPRQGDRPVGVNVRPPAEAVIADRSPERACREPGSARAAIVVAQTARPQVPHLADGHHPRHAGQEQFKQRAATASEAADEQHGRTSAGAALVPDLGMDGVVERHDVAGSGSVVSPRRPGAPAVAGVSAPATAVRTQS